MLEGISCMSWLLMSLSPCDTVDRSILDCALGRLGLPDWFRRVLLFLVTVRFVSGLSWLLVLVSLGIGMGGIPQGCPLSMVFAVALYVPWCLCLEVMPGIQPQLYADNLKCSAECPGALFDAARFTSRYVRAVGQDVSPGKCVLLCTSRSVRKAMKLYGHFWGW